MRALLLVLALAAAAPAQAALTEAQLAAVGAHPPAGARLPAALAFADGAGRRVTLDRVAAGRPLVLIFADYTCRHVCSPALALTADALRRTGLSAGRDYALAVIGIDPRDGIADARHMAATLAPMPDVARATTLLRGDAPAVDGATRALGYRYAYDAANDQFAHDAAVYVFARDGRLAATLPELGLQPDALAAAIGDKVPAEESLASRVAHLCYGFAAAQGRFARPVVVALQALALVMLAGAAALLWRSRRRNA